MAQNLHVMSQEEMEINALGASHPNIFFDYWFRKPGAEKGWQLDHGFTEEGKWQEDFVMASQPFIVTIAGISTGKSLTAVMGAGYHCTLTKGFKFLNVAKEGWQSMLMYKMFLEHAEGTRFQELIVASPKRPYPAITISYRVGELVVTSTMEFMSVGESGDATNIFSWRGDWINIEEAGRIDNLGEIVGNLSTRLTGQTSEGREFLGRLSLISNAFDNSDLWQLYDMAMADAEDGLVFNIDTHHNKNTTDKQIKLALKLLKIGADDRQEQFLTGRRPQGLGGFFTQEDIEKCESEILSTHYLEGIRAKVHGYKIEQNPVLGVWHLQTPKKPGRIYFMLGDPGIGAAPARNAPVVMVFDVTDVDKRIAPMVAFWWGNGGGSITPFVNKLKEWGDFYRPIFAGIDSTSTQKYMAELLNLTEFDINSKPELSFDGLAGLDFSSGKKNSYLVALRFKVEAGALQWPSFISGISSQLNNYELLKDAGKNAKLPQDTVATLAMVAWAIAAHYGYDLEGSGGAGDGDQSELGAVGRGSRETRLANRERRAREGTTSR